jgi:mRNA degradation ribonuclease J1/J2
MKAIQVKNFTFSKKEIPSYERYMFEIINNLFGRNIRIVKKNIEALIVASNKTDPKANV